MARDSHGLGKVSRGPPCPTLLRPVGGWPAAISYPFGHPAPYAYVEYIRNWNFSLQDYVNESLTLRNANSESALMSKRGKVL
jgi:hypothetical protein